MTKKVRWGIMSTAQIGRTQVVPAILKSPLSEVVAVASRDRAAAENYIAELGLTSACRAHGSYDALVANPEVDAIYNPLPNHLHVPMTLAAAHAGKHVLCEKPIALTAKEAEQLRHIPKGIVFYEAFMVRFHPQWLRMREIVRSGELGEIRAVHATFSYFNADPANVRNKADIGGGGVYDIGCYAVTASRFLFGSEPKRVVALLDRDPDFGTDRLASAIIDFDQGRQMSFICSTQASPQQSIQVLGTKARAELVIPFNPPAGMPTALVVDGGATLDGSLARREILPATDHYTEQANAFCRAVLGEGPLEWGVEDAILNMRVLDAIFASEKTQAWAEI